MKAGFSIIDITPRVGVELCGFGPYINRHSIGVRDRLYARAAAFEVNGKKALIVSCDLIGVTAAITRKVRTLVAEATGLSFETIMVHCTHTHSGPNTGNYNGWGDPDIPYLEILPSRIAKACIAAWGRLEEIKLYHAVVPCEGIGYNREYDNGTTRQDTLKDDWRPNRPELTDTECQVIKMVSCASGQMTGFMAYFGCHPVVCCADCRYIHGDFCGIALNLLQQENPGSIGLFLQGAEGDVNTCIVHAPEKESLQALDIIAARFAVAVRHGLRTGRELAIDKLKTAAFLRPFPVKNISLEKIRELLAENEAVVYAENAGDEDRKVRMAALAVLSLRKLLERIEEKHDLRPQGEIQGIRLGPIEFMGAPFEIMQQIKNDVVATAGAPIPLVMGICNDSLGYAPDEQCAVRGGYAADIVPIICGSMPYDNIHLQLVEAFLKLDEILENL